MIGYLKGAFVELSPSSLLIDVQGVGYIVHISLNTYSAIASQLEGIIYTHLIIREDAHILYGFYNKLERSIFIELTSVSGIGPNTARLILSSMKPEEIVQVISSGDSKTLEKVKGIGKKTAERAIVELKDKIGKSSDIDLSIIKQVSVGQTSFAPTIQQEAIDALQALGISKANAEQAVKKVGAQNDHLKLEELIKLSLKAI
ncbi:MAG: Holliday junction branch migration protein RuvA [Chitinophagaceae bacterium]|nr:MAG: Holliday junction branch migration protein RuvA [Chitinophagaceae bacterium]